MKKGIIIILLLLIFGIGFYTGYNKLNKAENENKQNENINNDQTNNNTNDNENKQNTKYSYKIEYLETYKDAKNLNILVTQADSAIVINFEEDVTDFIVYGVEIKDGELVEKEDSIYNQSQNFKSGEKVIIRTIVPETAPNIRISFKDASGKLITITPTYNGVDGNIIFQESKNK